MNGQGEPGARPTYDAAQLAETPLAPLCPVDRLPSRRRNRLFLQVITIGALNFVFYTLAYALIGGDAPNGERRIIDTPDGPIVQHVVRGHFIRSLDGREREVGASLWIYSYLHSITLPLTSGAMIVAMLLLARPHILATMRDNWLSGRAFIIGLSTTVIVISLIASIVFLWEFAAAMSLTAGG